MHVSNGFLYALEAFLVNYFGGAPKTIYFSGCLGEPWPSRNFKVAHLKLLVATLIGRVESLRT